MRAQARMSEWTPAMAEGSPFILLSESEARINGAFARGFLTGAVLVLLGTAIAVGVVVAVASGALAQTAAPDPAAYTFSFTSDQVNVVYNALERSSQLQAMITGERSPRIDALEAQIKQEIFDQKAAAVKAAAEKPKEEPKQ